MASSDREYTHPELELLTKLHPYSSWTAGITHKTSIDLIEISPNADHQKDGMNHEEITGYFEEQDKRQLDSSSTVKAEPTRIFLIHDLNFIPDLDDDEDAILEPDTTALWLKERFAVSTLFFRHIRAPNGLADAGMGSFLRRDKSGRRISIDGVYRVTFAKYPSSFIWFSHSLVGDHSSTYMIYRPALEFKNLLLKSLGERNRRLLLRPFAIDAFMLRTAAIEWQQLFMARRVDLLYYENLTLQNLQYEEVFRQVERAHLLSTYLHNIRDGFVDCQSVIDFLVDLRKRLLRVSPTAFHLHGDEDDYYTDSVQESLELLVAKIKTSKRWTTNFIERLGIRINLFFNVLTQMDSRTNLDIAKLTSKISVSTQRDSSSMITMAVVTMFFLPGTFVSALFSMVFFDLKEESETGRSRVYASGDWVLYLFVTIPLTMFVFLVWGIWRRRRVLSNVESINLEQMVWRNPPVLSRPTTFTSNTWQPTTGNPVINATTAISPGQDTDEKIGGETAGTAGPSKPLGISTISNIATMSRRHANRVRENGASALTA